MDIGTWRASWNDPITWGRDSTEEVDASLFNPGEPTKTLVMYGYHDDAALMLLSGVIWNIAKDISLMFVCQGNFAGIKW